MIAVCTWLWGDKFGLDDVARLFSAVRRNLAQPARLLVISEWNISLDGVECIPIRDLRLTKIKGCYARLRAFDPQWQADYGIADRLATIDLDTVITSSLDPLFDRPEPFVIMQKGNAANPCPFNGALQLLRAGAHPDVWGDFNVAAAAKAPFYEFPDDQGWLWHKLPNAAGWVCGPGSGVYVFRKPGWPQGSDALPEGARLVTFSGKRSPRKFIDLDWVGKHWS
jgi:hypothetical protein